MKIKKEHKGTIIRRGKFTINCNDTNPDHYQYYFDNGFSDIFEVEETSNERPCNQCQGNGCPNCNGFGTINDMVENKQLDIPALIEKTAPTKKKGSKK